MRPRPIHFHNEINKIAILNLENINVSPAAPSTTPGQTRVRVYGLYTRKDLSPAPVQLGDGARGGDGSRHSLVLS